MPDERKTVRRNRHRAVLVFVVALVLAGLYAVMRYFEAAEPQIPADRSISFALSVADAQSGGAVPALTARQGDKVTILIRSDVAGELHLHGYDREAELEPGDDTRLAFEADRSGQFPIELHESGGGHRDIARLVVEP